MQRNAAAGSANSGTALGARANDGASIIPAISKAVERGAALPCAHATRLLRRSGATLPFEDLEAVRLAWRDAIDPSSPKESSMESYDTLESTFVAWGERMLHEGRTNPSKSGLALELHSAPPFNEFIKHAEIYALPGMTVMMLDDLIYRDYPKAKRFEAHAMSYVACGGREKLMAVLMNGPDNYFVVSIMQHGFLCGSEAAALLRYNGKLSGFMLVGFSTGIHDNYRKDDYHRFKDGSSMCGKVLMPPNASGMVEMNRGNPVLLVDDFISSGITCQAVESFLRDLGFTKVLKIDEGSDRLYL